MDTKLKNNKHSRSLGMLLGLLLIVAIAVGAIAFYPTIYKNSKYQLEKGKIQEEAFEKAQEGYYYNEFIKTISEQLYSLLGYLTERK